MREKFFVLAVPRSRTHWLSHFLTTPTCQVAHEDCYKYSSIDEMLQNMPDGIVDTALIIAWKELKGKIVIIDRDIEDCIKSGLIRCSQFDGHDPEKTKRTFYGLRKILEEAMLVHPVVKFEDLSNEEVCKSLFEYLTEEEFDAERWRAMNSVNLQSDAVRNYQLCQEHGDNIRSLFGRFKCA